MVGHEQSRAGGRKAARRVSQKIEALSSELPNQRCTIPGCGRLAGGASGTGLSAYLCRYHQQRKSRHGSPWAKTLTAKEVEPYIRVAQRLVKSRLDDPGIRAALGGVNWLLAFSGRSISAMDLRGLSAQRRAKIAFARLAEKDVSAQRLLAIYLGVSALLEDDWSTHRVEEFRLVQIAKAVHRLASGTHRHREEDGYEMHRYPRSAGLVLREIGKRLDKEANALLPKIVPSIIAAVDVNRGCAPHPSHGLPIRESGL